MHPLTERLDAAPMSRAQYIAVALTFLLSALDGYDVLAVAFASPAITADWGIGKAALGVVLSAGLAGMALGSLFVAPLADLVGRKMVVMGALTVMAVGMLACAFADGIVQMTVWRVLTGIGIGACVSVINPISAEFANARNRALTVAIMSVGYPVGGMIGGLLASWLLVAYSWPAVFIAGFVAAAVLLPVVAIFLPESLAWLVTRNAPDRLDRVNAVLARFGHPPVDDLPTAEAAPKRGYGALFTGPRIKTTIWLTAVNLLFVMYSYYMLSWMPQLVADAGHSASEASRVSAISSMIGIVGGLLFGFLAKGRNLRAFAVGAIAAAGIAAAIFGIVPTGYMFLMVSGAAVGLFLYASAAGLFTTIATSFEDEVRASGAGFVIGIGRIGSAISPLIAGWLFGTGLGRGEVTGVYAIFSLSSALVLLWGWNRYRPDHQARRTKK